MLKNKIINIPPSEKWWNIAQNRFDYQKNYIICKLLEKYDEEDFVLIVEYHDDFLILDNKENPQKIDFFQVKTKKNANWTSKSLSKKWKNNSHSIFWKMFLHIKNFNKSVKSSNFISNTFFNILLRNNTKKTKIDKFKISDLWDWCKNDFINSINKEFEKDDLEKHIDVFNFEKVELNIDNHEDLTISYLVTFIEDKFKAECRPKLIHDFLFRIIREKSNIEETISDFNQLIIKKWISKSDLEKIFEVLELDKKENEKIKTLKDVLIKEWFNHIIIFKYDDLIRKIRIEQINKSNKTFHLKVKQIKSIIENIDNTQNLKTIIENIFNDFSKIPKEYKELNDDTYIKILIAYEYFKTLN